MTDFSYYTGDDALRIEMHRRNAMSSQLLLRRLRLHHYECAPKPYKDRFLPSTIIGNPLLNLCKYLTPPVFVEDDIPECVRLEETKAIPTGSIKTILIAVSHYFRVSMEEIVGRRQTSKFVRPRHIAMYLAHEHTTQSIAGIGRAFDRDHTVILYAKNYISKQIKTDQVLALQVSIIRQQIAALDSMPTPEVVQLARSKRRDKQTKWSREREVLLVRYVKEGKGFTKIGKLLGITASTAFGKYTRMAHAASLIQAAAE